MHAVAPTILMLREDDKLINYSTTNYTMHLLKYAEITKTTCPEPLFIQYWCVWTVISKFHGRGTVRLADGGEIGGTWKAGARVGRCSTVRYRTEAKLNLVEISQDDKQMRYVTLWLPSYERGRGSIPRRFTRLLKRRSPKIGNGSADLFNPLL